MSPKLTTFMAIVVTTLWSLSMILDAINTSYDPPAPIHGAFMLVLGGVFGARLAGKASD